MAEKKPAGQWEALSRELGKSLERLEELARATQKKLLDPAEPDQKRLARHLKELREKIAEIRSIGVWPEHLPREE